MRVEIRDPMQRRFAEYSAYLTLHPPPAPMLWLLVELLRGVVDMVIVHEDRQRREREDGEAA